MSKFHTYITGVINHGPPCQNAGKYLLTCLRANADYPVWQYWFAFGVSVAGIVWCILVVSIVLRDDDK